MRFLPSRPQTEITKARISASLTGKSKTEEHKQRIRGSIMRKYREKVRLETRSADATMSLLDGVVV